MQSYSGWCCECYAHIPHLIAVAGMTSLTGMCHTFDAAADGYCGAEGCSAAIVQRIVVAGTNVVHGVVQGADVAHDGTSASLAAPNGEAAACHIA